ncbi:MAG: ATP-dependent zinc metalloprotease FtsH [Ruminococcaceae bacterium]|nr:ATP-dependent zinc metalloprotease FtsH [Oscillospiraceae bacterium]
MKKNIKIVIFYLILFISIIIVSSWILGGTDDEKLTYTDIKQYFYDEKVEEFLITNDNTLILTLRENTADSTDADNKTASSETSGNDSAKKEQIEYKLRSADWFMQDLKPVIDEQFENGTLTYELEAPVQVAWWVSFLPYLLILVFIVVIYFVSINQAMGGKGGRINSFGKSRAHLMSDSKNKVRFADVAGADEEKEELKEVVEFLKNPARFNELGARIPRGVLLFGPPGTGKTLLAKAVAGEAGVPFYSISGSDFVEMYVGVGASRVRDLFENAKKNAPAIIFIDEIDAVGRHRGAGLGGGHDEREQTLNQLLVEMDGFGSNEGVIVIAATNRPDILDPALLRPGRFDRQITVNYPDLKGRCEILKVHAKGKPFEEAVDLEKIAQTTVGFTGADLANLLNEAALHAARKKKKLIGMPDIEEAALKIMVGTQKKNRKFKPEEKKKTAYHEAGHAVLAHILPSVDPVRQISIIPSGRALGYTLTVPLEDKYSVYKKGLMEEITMILGGRVAEKVFFDDISGGASNDIQRATAIAKNMVTRYGMSDKLGPIAFANERSDDEVFLGRDFNNTKNYSEETAALIDAEIKRIIDECFVEAERLIRENEEKMHTIAEFLIQFESMDEDQFKFLMDTDPTPSIEEIAAIAEAKKQQSDSENAKKRQKIFTVRSESTSSDEEPEDAEDAETVEENETAVTPENKKPSDSDKMEDDSNLPF